MQKDVTLAGGLARELGVRLLTGAITEQVLREAQLRAAWGPEARRPRSSPWRTWPGSRCGCRSEPGRPRAHRGTRGRGQAAGRHSARVMRFPLRTKSAAQA